MKTSTSITSFQVSQPGQRTYFELDIPDDGRVVSGVYATVSGWKAPWDFTPKTFPPFYSGQLRLKWREAAGVFYSGEVDFSLATFADPQAVGAPLLPNLNGGPWSHTGMVVPVSVLVPTGNTTIVGLYHDQLNLLAQVSQIYTVRVYLQFQKGGQND